MSAEETEAPPVDQADIENVSGKLESFSLSDAIETSLYMQGMTAPATEPRRGETSHTLTTDTDHQHHRQEVTADSSAGVRIQCCAQGNVQTTLGPGQLTP